MDGNFHDCASLGLGDSARSQLILGLLPNVDVAVELGPAAPINDVVGDLLIPNDSGIQLAWTNIGTISSEGVVDCGNR